VEIPNSRWDIAIRNSGRVLVEKAIWWVELKRNSVKSCLEVSLI